jgi:hypothetical protein
VNLWPFSKKNKQGEPVDLPDGVVLASPDTYSVALAHEPVLMTEDHTPPAPTRDVPEQLGNHSNNGSAPSHHAAPAHVGPQVSQASQAAMLENLARQSAAQVQTEQPPIHRAPSSDIPPVWPPVMTGSETGVYQSAQVRASADSRHQAQSVPMQPSVPSVASSQPVMPAATHKPMATEKAELVWPSKAELDPDFIEPSKPLQLEALYHQSVDAPVQGALYGNEPEDLNDWLPSTDEPLYNSAPVQESKTEATFWENVSPMGAPAEASDDFFAPPHIRSVEDVSHEAADLPPQFRSDKEDDWLMPSASLAAAAHQALNTPMATTPQEPNDLLDYVDHSDSLSELYQTPEHTSDTWLTDVLSETARSAEGPPEGTANRKPEKPPRLKGFKEPVKPKEGKAKAPKAQAAQQPLTPPPNPEAYTPMALKPTVPPKVPASFPAIKPGESRIVPEGYLARQNANPLAPYQDSLSDNLERFGKAIIQEDTQFLKKSIDNLVAGYFSQKEADEDA